MRRTIVAALVLACLDLWPVTGQPAAPARGPHGPPRDAFFPVAVWYGGGKARAPMIAPLTAESEREWRRDVQAIKALGFNTVRTWVEWSAGEPRRGEYRLANLELMLRLAEEAGLRVIVQVYVDSAPDWVGRAHPDGRFTSQSGAAIESQAAPGYCVDHPGVRDALHAFYREVARRASTSPAFHAYDVWSEPAVMNWAQPAYLPNAQFCYCRHSLARFRRWLQDRHAGDLASLNERWYRTFSSWEQVEPPRFGTILTYTDFTDWRVYVGEKIAADLGGRTAAVKSVDAVHAVASHAPNPSPVFRTLADAMDASDDYLMKDVVDVFGTSFYPKLTSPDRDWPLERRALVMDMARSVTGDRGFHVGELQAGFGVHGIVSGNAITPQDLPLYTWGLVARGAKAVSYYAFYPMSTGYEAGGYGLIELDGTVTARARAAGATAALVHANADLLLSARPAPAEVAVIVNPLVPLLGGEQAYGDRRNMHRAVAGYHRMFFERNVAVEFPSAREITAERLRRFRLVILPTPLLLTAPMAEALEQYVREGGRLLAEARPGWQDERGHAQPVLPGFGWHRMFGVRETELRPVKSVRVHWGGRSFNGVLFAERFAPVEGMGDPRVVARYEDGGVAAVERAHGKGAAILLGTFAGEANQLEPQPMHPLADALIEWAGLARPALAATSFVELRRLEADRGEFLFLFNHGSGDATLAISHPLGGTARSARELITRATLPTPGRVLAFETIVPAESVRVYRVDY